MHAFAESGESSFIKPRAVVKQQQPDSIDRGKETKVLHMLEKLDEVYEQTVGVADGCWAGLVSAMNWSTIGFVSSGEK
jgi:hypothetical protein